MCLHYHDGSVNVRVSAFHSEPNTTPIVSDLSCNGMISGFDDSPAISGSMLGISGIPNVPVYSPSTSTAKNFGAVMSAFSGGVGSDGVGVSDMLSPNI